MAEQYYRVALQVHPHRATLHYHLGCALLASGSTDMALEALDRALELDPNNPVAKFERAKVKPNHPTSRTTNIITLLKHTKNKGERFPSNNELTDCGVCYSTPLLSRRHHRGHTL